MKADLKFKKRAAGVVDCNFTDVAHAPYSFESHPLRMRVYGPQDKGDWELHMNPLEAHRLLGQLSEALAAWAKVQIKNEPIK